MDFPTVEKAKEFFYEMFRDNPDPYSLIPHLPAVEKWANFILEKHPEADREVVLLGVWLHDRGYYPLQEEDHAITGEKVARDFLKSIGLNEDKIEKVARCVRRHRCRDMQPETIEEKIIAFSDSASHMTTAMYINILSDNKKSGYDAKSKLERDFRDLSYFPEVKELMQPLYEAWEKLITEYEKINKHFTK